MNKVNVSSAGSGRYSEIVVRHKKITPNLMDRLYNPNSNVLSLGKFSWNATVGTAHWIGAQLPLISRILPSYKREASFSYKPLYEEKYTSSGELNDIDLPMLGRDCGLFLSKETEPVMDSINQEYKKILETVGEKIKETEEYKKGGRELKHLTLSLNGEVTVEYNDGKGSEIVLVADYGLVPNLKKLREGIKEIIHDNMNSFIGQNRQSLEVGLNRTFKWEAADSWNWLGSFWSKDGVQSRTDELRDFQNEGLDAQIKEFKGKKLIDDHNKCKNPDLQKIVTAHEKCTVEIVEVTDKARAECKAFKKEFCEKSFNSKCPISTLEAYYNTWKLGKLQTEAAGALSDAERLPEGTQVQKQIKEAAVQEAKAKVELYKTKLPADENFKTDFVNADTIEAVHGLFKAAELMAVGSTKENMKFKDSDLQSAYISYQRISAISAAESDKAKAAERINGSFNSSWKYPWKFRFVRRTWGSLDPAVVPRFSDIDKTLNGLTDETARKAAVTTSGVEHLDSKDLNINSFGVASYKAHYEKVYNALHYGGEAKKDERLEARINTSLQRLVTAYKGRSKSKNLTDLDHLNIIQALAYAMPSEAIEAYKTAVGKYCKANGGLEKVLKTFEEKSEDYINRAQALQNYMSNIESDPWNVFWVSTPNYA